MANIYLLLLPHLQQPGPLVVPGLVPEVHQYVGVEAEHDGQGDHKYYQEHCSEVSLLQALRPPTEVTGAFFPDCWFCWRVVCQGFQGDREYEEAGNRRNQGGHPCSAD